VIVRFNIFALFAICVIWPAVVGAQTPAEIEQSVNTMVRLCLAGGERFAVGGGGSGGADVSLRSFDVKGKLTGEFKVDKSKVEGLVEGINNAMSQVAADQADKVRTCLQPLRERLLDIMLPPKQQNSEAGSASTNRVGERSAERGGQGRAQDVVPEYENQFLHARLTKSGAQPKSATISVEIKNTTARPIRLGFIRSYNESILNTADGIQCQMNGSATGLSNLLTDEIQRIEPSTLNILGPSKTQVISYSFWCVTALQDTSATLISKMVGQVDGSLESFFLALSGIPIELRRTK
jgi:hypothetical protein